MNKYLLLYVFILSTISKSISQCCSPGNPAGGIGTQGVMEKKAGQVMLFYKGGYSDTYYGGQIGGNKPITNDPGWIPAVKNANYNFAGLNFRFGVSNRLTIESDLGYFINKTQNYNDGILPSQFKGWGLTDLAFQLKLLVLKKREWEITPAAGIKIPIGPTEMKGKDGTTIPLVLQPTTGAFAYTGGLLIYKGFPEKHLRFFLEGKFEYPTLTKITGIDYKYGNSYFASFIATYSFAKKWVAIIQVRNENRERDIKYENPTRIIYSTGSHKIFIVPQINYSINDDWNILLLADVPIYQYYYGKQLGTKFAIGISIFKKFNIKQKPSDKTEVVNP